MYVSIKWFFSFGPSLWKTHLDSCYKSKYTKWIFESLFFCSCCLFTNRCSTVRWSYRMLHHNPQFEIKTYLSDGGCITKVQTGFFWLCTNFALRVKLFVFYRFSHLFTVCVKKVKHWRHFTWFVIMIKMMPITASRDPNFVWKILIVNRWHNFSHGNDNYFSTHQVIATQNMLPVNYESLGSKFWLKFFNDNDGLAEKKARPPVFRTEITAVTGIS